MVQKAINIKAKISLQSNTIVWDIDSYCPKGHCSSNSIISKVQTQETITKKSRSEKFKVKDSNSALAYINAIEILKQNKKDKKKKTREHRQNNTKKRKNQIPATDNNTIDASKKKKMTLMSSYILVAIKKATIPALIPNL